MLGKDAVEEVALSRKVADAAAVASSAADRALAAATQAADFKAAGAVNSPLALFFCPQPTNSFELCVYVSVGKAAEAAVAADTLIAEVKKAEESNLDATRLLSVLASSGSSPFFF